MINTLTCRVCHSSEGRSFKKDEKTYFRCRNCQTLQLAITENEYLEIDRGYDPGVYLHNKSKEYVQNFLKVHEKVKVIKRVKNRSHHSDTNLSFLDVGCGMGGYMLAAKELGMDVLGFEPSIAHGSVAKNLLGLPVETEYFSSQKVNGRKFDIILLSHVIEHIYAPKEFVEDLVSALNPGGVLLMVTPNAGSLTAKITGKSWPMLAPLDHVTMLSKGSVSHIIPNNYSVDLSSSEYPAEFLMTLASVAKSMMKKKIETQSEASDETNPSLIQEVSFRTQLLKFMLALGSIPFYLFARVTNNAAALIIMVQKNR